MSALLHCYISILAHHIFLQISCIPAEFLFCQPLHHLYQIINNYYRRLSQISWFDQLLTKPDENIEKCHSHRKQKNTVLCNIIPLSLCNLKGALMGNATDLKSTTTMKNLQGALFPPHLTLQGEIPKNVLVKAKL